MARADQFLPALQRLGLTIKKRTATGASGAVTLNAYAGTITTESLSTAAGGTQSYVITNSKIKADSVVAITVGNGSNSAGSPVITTVTPANGSVTVVVQNIHASAALNGTLKLNFVVH